MNVIDNDKLTKIIERIGSIDVDLKWEHTQGFASIEREFHFHSYVIEFFFRCSQNGFFYPGDFYTAPVFKANPLIVRDFEFNMYDKNGDAINLTNRQLHIIEAYIKKIIKLV